MELGNQFASGIVVSLILDWLKNSGWFRWLSPDSEKWVKMTFGGVAAFITTVGITYTFDYNPTTHGWHAGIDIPSLHAMWDFAKQWAFQEFVYRAQVKK